MTYQSFSGSTQHWSHPTPHDPKVFPEHQLSRIPSMIVQVINEIWLDFYLSNFMGNLRRNIKQQHKLDKNASGILNTFERSLKAEVGDVVTGNVSYQRAGYWQHGLSLWLLTRPAWWDQTPVLSPLATPVRNKKWSMEQVWMFTREIKKPRKKKSRIVR